MSSQAAPKRSACDPWVACVAEIIDIQAEIDSVATYRLRFVDPEIAATYRFLPGQFNMLYLPGCGESAISHSGPHDSPTPDFLHTIRFVGRVTQSIAKLRVGDQLGVRGPFGTAWPLDRCRGRDVIIMSGGLGLAPLRPLIYALLAQRRDFGRVVLLHGARSPEQVLYPNELKAWHSQGLEVQLTVDRGADHWHGQVGVVPLLLDRLPQLVADRTEVLTCGPEIMMHYSVLSALQRGIPETSLWLSMERNMQCAAGICGHCQWGPLFVCKDGPVFRYDRIKSLLEVRDL
jgi:NAD(P)H-flavin reductase